MLLNKWKHTKLSSKLSIIYTAIFSVAIITMAVISLFLIQRYLLVNSNNDVTTLRTQVLSLVENNSSAMQALPPEERVDEMKNVIEGLFGSKDQTYFYIEDTLNVTKSANEEKFKNDTANQTILDINSLKINISGLGDNATLEDLVINRYSKHESTILLTKAERDSFELISQFDFDGNKYLYTAVTFEVEGYTMIIHIIKGLQFNHQLIMTLGYSLLLSGIISMLLIIFVGRYTTKRALSPLNNMAKTMKKINDNQLHLRVPTSETHDELQDLSESINSTFDKLEAVFESQSRFVSDASHELRIPLTIIKGYLDLYNSLGKDNEAIAKESMIAIEEETQNMQQLVENLLLLSRIDKKGLQTNMTIFDIKPFLEKVISDSSMISNRHQFITGPIEDGRIHGDEKLLMQIFRALVENSVKYTPDDGEITLSATSDQNYCNISVKDTGIGIDEKDIPHLFDRFYRCDSSRDKASGGTGLGLSIVDSIVKLHDGHIKVFSEKELGTEIIIQIPKAL